MLHARTWSVSCEVADGTMVYLNGSYHLYRSKTGELEQEPVHRQLKYLHLQSEAADLDLPSQIFSKDHLARWNRKSAQTPLDDLLSTLSRQQQVLRAMGLRYLPDHELSDAARESSENLFNGGWFSFLFGNHVGSPQELWSFGCIVLVSGLMLSLIIRCICTRSGLSKQIVLWRQPPGPAITAAIEGEEPSEESSLCEPEEQENDPNDEEEVRPAPPYQSIYPALPTVTFDDEVRFSSSRVTVRPGKAHDTGPIITTQAPSQQ